MDAGTNTVAGIITKPIVAVTSGATGVLAWLGSALGFVNIVLGTLIAIVGLATACLGLYLKIREARKK